MSTKRFGITFSPKEYDVFDGPVYKLEFDNLAEAEIVYDQLGKQFYMVSLHDEHYLQSNGVTSITRTYYRGEERVLSIKELPPEEVAKRLEERKKLMENPPTPPTEEEKKTFREQLANDRKAFDGIRMMAEELASSLSAR